MSEINDKENCGLISRRTFVGSAAALGSGLAIGCHLPSSKTYSVEARQEFAPNAWLRIAPDNRVTFVLDRVEMGQGVYTALAMLVAEELDIAPQRLEIENAPADRKYANPDLHTQSTGGSTSVKAAWKPLREAGALARAMLLEAAAQKLGVLSNSCSTEDGVVLHHATGRRLSYGDLAIAASSLEPVPFKLKDRSAFKYIGKPMGRLDSHAKATGAAIFGIDVRLPGMLHAVVVHSPIIGAKVTSFDATKALAIAGVKHVFQIHSGVAIVAASHWLARQGAEALQIVWDESSAIKFNSEDIRNASERLIGSAGKSVTKIGDFSGALTVAARVFEQHYEVPYLAHATMEPQNFTAYVKGDHCEIWGPTQSPGLAQYVAAEVAGLERKNIQVHVTFLGGGFGRRLNQDFVAEAVAISKKLQQPVQLIWTREDDMRHDFYRPGARHLLRAGLDKDSQPTAWGHRIVSQSILEQVIPEWLPEMAPDWVPGFAVKAAGRLGARLMHRTVPDMSAVEGVKQLAYEIPNVAIDYHNLDMPIPVGFWRSVGHSGNAFVVESFIDELAHEAKLDPYQFRRQWLRGKDRELRVLDAVAQKTGWGSSLTTGVFRGIAQHACFGSVVAQVAEISLASDGAIQVQRIVCSIDCGFVVNPDGVRAQIESAIIFGLSAALFGEITWDKGQVMQSNFDDYPVVRMTAAPRIEVVLLDSDADPSGAGEPGTPPVAPAVANAVFAATGKRLRRLPLSLEKI